MFTYTLTNDQGDTHRIKADTRDVYVWERVNQYQRTLNDLGRPRVADHYGLAAIASKRAGIDLGDANTIAQTWTLDVEPEEPDPTKPVR